MPLPELVEMAGVTPSGDEVSNGYRYVGVFNSYEDAEELTPSQVEWSCEADDDSTDPIELTIEPAYFASLVAKARAYDTLVQSGDIDPL